MVKIFNQFQPTKIQSSSTLQHQQSPHFTPLHLGMGMRERLLILNFFLAKKGWYALDHEEENTSVTCISLLISASLHASIHFWIHDAISEHKLINKTVGKTAPGFDICTSRHFGWNSSLGILHTSSELWRLNLINQKIRQFSRSCWHSLHVLLQISYSWG